MWKRILASWNLSWVDENGFELWLQKNRFSCASSSTIWLRFGSIKTRCAESINWWMLGIHQQAKGHALLERPFMPNTYSKLINYFMAHDLVPFKNAQKSNEISASCDFIFAQFFLLMKIKIGFLTETDRSEEEKTTSCWRKINSKQKKLEKGKESRRKKANENLQKVLIWL